MPATVDPLIPTKLLPQVTAAANTADVSGMRIHELAIQKWFYSTFFVAAGYPIPVVFSNPMDAFSEFQKLWEMKDKNPFKFLLDAKAPDGTALYEPYPAPARYPIISVSRKGWAYRTTQSYGLHTYRNLGYSTVNNVVDNKLTRRDLAVVKQSAMATAWDFKFQVDHYCTHPGTQATFIQSVMRKMRYGGGIPQTFIRVAYPGVYGHQVVRVYLEGNIENVTQDEPGEAQTEYRTSLNLVVEGYSPDLDITLQPALWQIVIGTAPLSITDLEALYAQQPLVEPALVATVEDLRDRSENAAFNSAPNLPPTQ